MISTQHEIETLINEKFMQKIQPTTITYEIQKPDMYDNDTDKYMVEEDKQSIQNDYHYLHDELLDKIIEPTSNTEYHYVLYNFVNVTTKPFVKFLMYNSNKIMKFPNEKALIENNDESETESESSDILPYDDENDEIIDEMELYANNVENEEEYYLEEQCSRYLEKNFGIEYEKSNDNYKGYVKVEDKLYMFIDVSAIEMIFPENEVFSWVIMDEILNKRLSNNVPICNIVLEMFSINNQIKNIYDENNDIIEYPICVYLCKKGGEEDYINVESKSSTNMSLISDKLEHPIFGKTTMFSTERINIDDKMFERYCLFTTDAVYVLHSNFTKYEVDLIIDKSCVRFIHKAKEYWSVKNSSLYLHI